MKILFFNPEQYVDFLDEPSNIQLRLPILHCGLDIEARDFVYQRPLRAAGGGETGRAAMDRAALEAVAVFRPDVVVYSATWESENLSPETLRTIRDQAAPVVTMLWDSWIEPTTGEAELLAASSVLVTGDSLRTYLRCRLIGRALSPAVKVAFAGGQVFTDLIRPLPDEPKQYDVTLLGSNEGERAKLVAYLAEALPRRGLSFNKAGGLVDSTRGGGMNGLSDDWVGWEAYVKIINRSRLCLNSPTDPSRVQIKGKIFDYMACGVACLTDDNVEVARFLPPGAVAYFSSPDDCLSRILELLGDDAARRRIAGAGRDWLTANFGYKDFWRAVIEAALNPKAPPPTSPTLEAACADLQAARGLTLRQSLAEASILAGAVLSGGAARRLAVRWLGARRGFHRLAIEGGGALAINRMPADVVACNGRLFVAAPGFDMTPLPLPPGPGPAEDAKSQWLKGRRGAAAVAAADIDRLDALLDQAASDDVNPLFAQ